ncbi:FtsX-like permease family protein [Agromyces sp. CFH 90414]|uniref:FtsX-like permease family protein n=1 Tax=Agromyces agglutinans TaxID=2662258 RepID=A0A6I2FHZ2_9MICO|nr:FtsX-like permease family protein [Agromyces agglutinans]MRG61573.1 FtsX-like permease family protein [Agromyces agglutinans]
MSRGLRDHLPTLLVAALAAAFGVALLQVTGILAAVIAADDVAGSSGTVAIMLNVTAFVFIAIAVYVAAVTTANTVATVVAGRTRLIALLRLIGSSARSQRAAIAREGLVVGALGAVAGALLGTGVAWGVARVGVAAGVIPEFDYGYLQPVLLVPMVAVVFTTWLAAWAGSRRVLAVRPAQALGNSAESSTEEVARRVGRTATGVTLIVLGVLALAGGVAVGLLYPMGVLIGVVGGILSFTGIVLIADRIMPPVLRAIGRLLGSSPSTRLAAENAVRHPERATRMTIGLVVGVTLVTMFAVTMETYRQAMTEVLSDQEMLEAAIGPVIDGTVAVFSGLVGFSAVIAAVGLVNTLSISVLQRTREIGLLRALGFDRTQVRTMILAEAAALTVAATLTGLVLGTVYGWLGAQSMLGSLTGEPRFVVPVVPWLVIAIVVVAAVAVTLAASVTPARRAVRISPVVALAVD